MFTGRKTISELFVKKKNLKRKVIFPSRRQSQLHYMSATASQFTSNLLVKTYFDQQKGNTKVPITGPLCVESRRESTGIPHTER